MEKASPRICLRCSNLDLDKIFFDVTDLENSSGSVPLADIDGLSRNCRRAFCDVCRFLASSTTLLDRAVLADTWHLRTFDYDSLRFDDVDGRQAPASGLAVTLVPGSINDPLPASLEVTYGHCILPTRGELSQERRSYGYHGRLIAKLFDFAHVRSWIDKCVQNHVSCSPPTRTAAPVNLHVIDCDTTEVVALPGSEYVALSYCIGPRPTRHKSKRPSKGIRRFPKVVADTIRCCRGMGYRYLWVDQVCIDQADPVALADAISKMHQIYSMSALTIVSLGQSQDTGLAGISGTYRSKQAYLRTNHATYISTMSSLPQAIHSSKWNTRAWCYQEAILSQRILFVGSDQTYFVCRTSMCQESIDEEQLHSDDLTDVDVVGNGDDDYKQMKRFTSYALELHKGVADHGRWDYAKWLENYSTRDLSYQSDTLNAFRGILNRSSHHTYWGIPLPGVKPGSTVSSYSRAFAIGMSWATTYNRDPDIYAWYEHDIPTGKDFYRRSEFPSWSWAGCRVFRSPVAYKVPGDFDYEAEAELDINADVTGITIELEDERGKMVSLADAVNSWPVTGSSSSSTKTKLLPEKSKSIEIETQTFPLRLSRIRTNRILTDNSGFAKFCVRVPGARDGHSGQSDMDTTNTLVSMSALTNNGDEDGFCGGGGGGGVFAAPDDGRFLVDFDIPPAAAAGRPTFSRRNHPRQDVDYCEEILHRQYLGLVLFFRPDRDRDRDPGSNDESASDEEEEVHEDRNMDIREEEDETDLGGSYCVLICQPKQQRQNSFQSLTSSGGIGSANQNTSMQHYQRVGLVWIEDDHLKSFRLCRKKLRLC